MLLIYFVVFWLHSFFHCWLFTLWFCRGSSKYSILHKVWVPSELFSSFVSYLVFFFIKCLVFSSNKCETCYRKMLRRRNLLLIQGHTWGCSLIGFFIRIPWLQTLRNDVSVFALFFCCLLVQSVKYVLLSFFVQDNGFFFCNWHKIVFKGSIM